MRLALGALETPLPAAMLPAALLALGFPKPPDYSVLSRRLSSLQSDEVRVWAALVVGSCVVCETTWYGSSAA